LGFIEAIILGLVQGLTEFLPISSSAHLRIVGLFFEGAVDPGATFTAITQIGTELAVVVFFRRAIVRIISQWFRSLGGSVPRNDPDARMGWLIILGSLPIAILGYLLQDTIRSTFRSLWLIAIVLIVFGVLLGVADYMGKRTRELKDLSYGHGVLYGLAQSLALIPGRPSSPRSSRSWSGSRSSRSS
jgi:undecaprenyl-diphosphatase